MFVKILLALRIKNSYTKKVKELRVLMPKMGFAPWKFNISANKIVIHAVLIVGWSALLHQSQHWLAGFEKHLDLPALSVDTDNFLFEKNGVDSGESKPIFTVCFISYTDYFDRNEILFLDMTSKESRYFELSWRFLLSE